MLKRYWLLSIFTLGLLLFTSACGSAAATKTDPKADAAPSSFTIAYQPGLSSVTLITLKTQKTLDKEFPHTTFQWKILTSGASVREAVISNQAQLGSLGLPPFLVGWDHGLNWKVLSSATRSESWLVAKDPRIKSLKDIKPDDKIGVVAPDSQQAIILRKEAQKQLGDAHALDRNIVSITSADGQQALLTGQIAAHLSGAPFQQQEVAAGGHIVLRSTDTFGPVGAGLLALPQSIYDQYPNFAKKLREDVLTATQFVKTHHDEASQYLAQDQGGGGASATQFKTLLEDPTFALDTTPSGLVSYANFMKSIGLISKAPKSVKELELPFLNGIGS